MSFIRALRTLAIIEGVSTLVLFGIAMPLKYFAGLPLAVRIVGSLHALAAAGIAAAVVPGGPFLLDRHLARHSVPG